MLMTVRHEGMEGRSTGPAEVLCCGGDGGRPTGIRLQDRVSNPLMRLESKALVVSDQEKAGEDLSGESQEGERE